MQPRPGRAGRLVTVCAVLKHVRQVPACDPHTERVGEGEEIRRVPVHVGQRWQRFNVAETALALRGRQEREDAAAEVLVLPDIEPQLLSLALAGEDGHDGLWSIYR